MLNGVLAHLSAARISSNQQFCYDRHIRFRLALPPTFLVTHVAVSHSFLIAETQTQSQFNPRGDLWWM
jgi:hypothetical protein